MSAIAGIFYFHGAPLEPGLIEALTSMMSGRGPDSQTYWIKGSIGLGHCMLHATPESLVERQPLKSPDEKLVLVWDGRLDNREELRRALNSHGVVLRDNSDAEMVIHSYAAWGEKCSEHLLGDFAFAVWDVHKSKLFCVRDHVGARPFYFTHNDRYFAFASEDEALLQLPGVSLRPNEEWIATMFVPAFERCIDPCQAWVDGVRFLGSGQQILLAGDGRSDLSTYWKLEPREDLICGTDEGYEEAFYEIFNESVRCRMRSVVGPAIMMSGGLDSASIASMIKSLVPATDGRNIQTYSAISDDADSCIESRCIQKLTSEDKGKANYLSVPSMNGMINLQDLTDFVWSDDRSHPIDNSVLLPAMMCLGAHRNSQQVILHGACGDLANHAPGRYQAYLLREGLFRNAWRECVEACHNNPFLIDENPSVLMLKNTWSAFAPQFMKVFSYRVRGGSKKGFFMNGLIGKNLYEKLRIEERLVDLACDARRDTLPNYRLAHRNILFPLGLRIGLEAYDRVAGRCGLEARDPWADKRVLEFLVNLPLQYKIRHGWTKYLIRTALVTDLDTEIRWRRDKEHLGWHLHTKLIESSDELVTDLISDKQGDLYEYIDRDTARFHLQRFKQSKNPESADYCVWAATLAHWVNRMQNL